ERGLDLVVSLLAILKAGGAYVPLDPSYPPQRIAFMLEDAHAHIVITQEHLLAHLPPTEARVAAIDRDSVAIAGEAKDVPTRVCTPKNLAYVIYTSGSTGKPKGVMIQHESVAALLAWSREIYSPEEMAGVLACASICFDYSVFELFAPLTCGGTVILARNALELPQLPCADQVRLVSTVPSAMTELLNMGGVPAGVKTVNLAGEALADALVERVYRELPIERAFNLYGPSEDTTFSTYCQLARESGAKVSIGKVITNSQAYVLDEWLEPLPIGTAGELYLGGAGLARGYLDRPDLTAERFIPDPFSQTLGARLYRTGDRVRHLADGQLDYLGRMDHQVKLRGFRIELGEVETVLAQCAGVMRAVALVREDTPGDKRLVAYVAATKPFPTVAGLRGAVAQSLPEYMVPNAIVLLEKLPLNSNGKIDRAALPVPEYGGDGAFTSLTPTEEMLAGIWSQILRTENVGSGDNFFDLGGHSLLATQAISRVRQVFQAEIPLRALFEFPVLSAFAKRVEEARRFTEDVAPVLARADRSAELPLSFAQQRMWFVDQLEPGTAAYNIPFGLRLKGELDVAAFQHGLEEIVRRHEVLRTAFPSRNGKPVQEIAEELKLHIGTLDLSALEMEAREGEARRCARYQAEAPFDLNSGPLVRAQLVRLAAEDHLLLVTMHHIISDGWSLGIFAREFAELYAAFRQARTPVLNPLPVQFADFAAWQWEQAQRGALSGHLEYWRKQLAGLEAIELPTDHTRPAVFHSRAARQPVFLSSELTSKLKESSRREGVTLFMTLLAVFQILMARYSGQEDIAIGTDIANRNRMESEDLIGCLVNQLVLRSKVDRESSFSELLKQVRETVLDAYAHQDLPFDVLVDEFNPQRDLSRTPLFQVLLTLENTPRTGDLRLPGLEVAAIEGDPQWAKFDLHVSLREIEGRVEGVVEYATSLFDGETVMQLIGHWERLLDAAAQNPDERVGSLSMLAPEELDRQLIAWNNTATARRQTYAHRLFEEQAEREPSAPAVLHENTVLTYGELNRHANQLARYLRKKGVGPEIRAAVCLARTPRLVTALLAVLKAGGVYVPLDPNYPPERLTYIREDSGARVLITENGAAHLVAGAGPGSVLSLDAEWGGIEKEDDGNLSTNIDSRNLSYSMYTSGSTGKPKGALIEHRGMLNHLFAKVKDLKLTREDVVAETAPSSFDISVWQILAPLLAGGRVQIIDDETVRDGAALLEEAARTGVTVLETVPAMLGAMLADEERRPQALPKLRWMISNAEALPIGQCERWSEEYPDVPLLNAYGPTECSDDIAHYEVEPGAIEGSAYAPLGRPLMNTTVYVLDEAMQPLPVGAVGELYIGGAGVGRGYWKRPELTAERFVPNPFSAAAGERLYRTGDLMRWRRDEMLEFIGRVDDQIKLRGFRIELGEIEAVLEEHPGTERALVMVREDEPGRKELAAYIVAAQSLTRADLIAELRELCRARLPHYMAPGAITVLDSFPLSPNGKIDRKALPRPERRSNERVLEQMPQTEVEQTLAAIWGEVLKMDSIGAEENFFEIGGHSLLATQVIARLRQAFAVDLPLRTIFEWPTVRGLAEQIEQQNSALNIPLPAGLQIERKLSEEELMLASLDNLSEEEISGLIEKVGQAF
ncbi:MAG TPA: amino acid adenylation domain-containing protein, partial [Bryobacteraceae bacterium]|nr:amino acid adenylation domain-containing protein [Bryobacteraceae bacterium]